MALIWTDDLAGLMRLHRELPTKGVTIILEGETADAAAKLMAGKG